MNNISKSINNTYQEYPQHKTVIELFQERVAETPNKTALVCNNTKISYDELNKRSNILAHYLIMKGVKKNDKVAILSDNNKVEMVIAIIAVIKTCAAYIPISPEFPADRVHDIIEDSKAKVLLGNREFLSEKIISECDCDIIELEKEVVLNSNNISRKSDSNTLMYIIYTSGSTGKPKGVMINQAALVNFCFGYSRIYELNDSDKVVKYAGVAFDVSVGEIFPTLLFGAELHLIDKNLKLDLIKLNKYFQENGITVSYMPPVIYEQFIEFENKSLRVVMVGGDKLKKFKKKNYRVLNGYGPTEATVWATYFEVEKAYDNIPIGKPVDNYRVYVINKKMKLCEIDEPGELCISGVALADGYLNRPEQTADKFLDNPFESEEEKKKGFDRIYKTGDLVKLQDDGNIVFLGRIDFQVKIRGYRIELGEIENKLLEINGVDDVLVMALDDEAGNKYLCGYYLGPAELNIKKIQKLLSKNLPNYMIPQVFCYLEKFPLNPSGKIDRKALPAPDISSLRAEYVPARNEFEVKLIAHFEEALKIPEIGIRDNFFELGGNSLKAVVLASKLQTMDLNVSVADIFTNPTVESLASLKDKAGERAEEIIGKAPVKEYYATSGSQRSMYLTDKMGDVGDAYNLPMMIQITGNLNREQLGIAINELIQRNEVFRTSFNNIDGEIVQIVHEKINYRKEYLKVNEHELNLTVSEFIKHFDLNKAPLFRIKLLKLSKNKHILFFDVHHILFDGTSLVTFINELFSLYQKKELPQLQIQYKDYAEWEKGYIQSEEYKEKGKYWISTLSDSLPVLEMPLDRPRSKNWNYRGDFVKVKLEEKQVSKLLDLAKKEGITLYTLTLAVYYVLLSKYSRQEDIIVGAAVSGRMKPEVQSMIGMFVNMLPLRTLPAGNKAFKEFLREVKKSVTGLLANQDYSLQKIVEELKVKPEIGRNPIFDVGFNYLGEGEYEFGNLEAKVIIPKLKSTQFDMTLTVFEEEKDLSICVDFKTALFERETVERFITHYIFVLEQIAADSSVMIKEIDLLTESQKNEILYTFNNTYAEFPDKTIVQLFEEAVDKYPDNIAVVYKNDKITYRDLNRKVNKIASFLRKYGVERESRVGVFQDRGIDIVASMLAVLKSGGCYVPIDSKYPIDRIEFMLEDSSAVQIVSKKTLIDSIGFNGEFLDINNEQLYENEPETNPKHINSPSDLACLIYTSGSTGKPKGAMLDHKNLVNFSCWYKNKREIIAGENIAEHSSFSFDAAIMGTYPVLFSGATEHILPEEIRLSLKDIDNYFTENKIKGCFFTTQLGEQYNEEYDNQTLRFVEVGGEKLKKCKTRSYKFINGYGPTESTVYVTDFEADKDYLNIPIGKPLSNVKLYIVDKEMKLCPIGVPGELCISGHNLGRGYLNREDLTTEKFIPNPFCTEDEKNNGYDRIYKTGDLARWLSGGNIEVIGRIDFQVKIRGFRIELGEVETRLIEIPNIDDATVVALDDLAGNKYLCAYYVSQKQINKNEIKSELNNNLPDYMVPNIYVQMDKFPLTPNGKVNRKALPKPDLTKEMTERYVAPETEMEKKLAEIWGVVLDSDKIGIKDNFFELGGNSLKAVSLVSKMQSRGYDVSISLIFAHPTIKELAEELGKAEEYTLRSKFNNIFKRVQNTIELYKSADLLSEIDRRNKRNDKDQRKYTSEFVDKRKDLNTVLLTGATGYLGTYILKYLMDNTNRFVYCIVRVRNDEAPKKRLMENLKFYFGDEFTDKYSDRIEVLNGNLSSEQLGLKKEVYEKISEEVQSIIHSAALVAHYGEYDLFYKANALPVKYLVDFALTGTKKDIHYVSTRSVCELVDTGDKPFKVIDEYDDLSIMKLQDNVYAKTKLEGEFIAIEARKQGINTSIYRVGNLVFNSQNGNHQKNINDNWFYQILNTYLNIGYIPDTVDEIEMSYIDKTAGAICELIDKENLLNEIYHLYNPARISVADLLTSPELGLNIQKTGFKDFIEIIYERFGKAVFEKYIENLLLHMGWQEEEEMRAVVLQDKTNYILNKIGFSWGKIKPSDFQKTIEIAFEKRFEWLSKLSIMKNISEESLHSLTKKLKLNYINNDEYLITEENKSDKLYFIVGGILTESKKSVGGWEGILRMLSSQSIIGLENLFVESFASSVNIKSKFGIASYMQIDKTQIRKLAMQDTNLMKNLLTEISGDLIKLRRMIIALG